MSDVASPILFPAPVTVQPEPFMLETSLPLVTYNAARSKGGFQRLLADAQEDFMAVSDGQKRHFDTRNGS